MAGAGVTIPLPYIALPADGGAAATPFFGTIYVGPLAQCGTVEEAIAADLTAAAAGRRAGVVPPGRVVRLEAAGPGGQAVTLQSHMAVFSEC